MSAPPTKKIRRSRLGCHRCKRLKIKCTEERPNCSNCAKSKSTCDYSLKLTWGGRPFKNKEKHASPAFAVGLQHSNPTAQKITFVPEQSPANFKSSASVSTSVPPPPVEKDVRIKLETLSDPVHIKTEDLATQFVQDAPHSALLNHNLAPTPNSKSQELDIFSSQAYVPEIKKPPRNGKETTLIPQDLFLVSPKFSPSDVDSLIMQRLSPPPDISASLKHDPYSTDIACVESLLPAAAKSPYFTDFYSLALKSSPQKYENYSPVPFYTEDGVEEIQNESIEHEEALSVLNSIPPSLVPLPEILLKVSFYRELFHFWMDVAAENLVPAPSSIYQDNPFKVILPQMAMHYPGLLTTILAFSAKAKQALDPNGNNYQPVIDQLLRRSCDELLNLLYDKNEATSDGTLAMILLLSGYETVSSNDFEKHRTHTIGASEIIYTRVGQAEVESRDSDGGSSTALSPLPLTSPKDESDITFFLMRWFAYIDVLGALAATRGQDNYLRAYKKRGAYVPVESVLTSDFNSPPSNDPKRDIDYLLGFDVRLLCHFVNIALLIDEVNKYLAQPGARTDTLPISIVTAAIELRSKFMKAYEDGEERRTTHIDDLIQSKLKRKRSTSPQTSKNMKDLVQHDNILRATNKAYFDAGLLNLYRRVLLVPRSSPIVQELAAEMADILEFGIELSSPAEICTIFCHFCAGCETLDPVRRAYISQRFTKLSLAGNVNATKSLLIMQRCWDTGEDWITAANVLDIDVVLL